MTGKKGSCVEINIPSSATTKSTKQQLESGKKKSAGNGGDLFSCKAWIDKVWEFAKEDSNRVIFSFKVGLAVLLVSLLILFRAPYEVFGTNIIWSILTVAIMFEYTVGMSMHYFLCSPTCETTKKPNDMYAFEFLQVQRLIVDSIVHLEACLLVS